MDRLAPSTVSRKIFFEKGVFLSAVRHETLDFATTAPNRRHRATPAVTRILLGEADAPL
jgi:hypothetical protein